MAVAVFNILFGFRGSSLIRVSSPGDGRRTMSAAGGPVRVTTTNGFGRDGMEKQKKNTRKRRGKTHAYGEREVLKSRSFPLFPPG